MNGFEQYLVYKVKQFKNESESWVLGADCMREPGSHLVQVWIFFFCWLYDEKMYPVRKRTESRPGIAWGSLLPPGHRT